MNLNGSHESLCGSHKSHPEIEKCQEFAKYEEIKGLHVAVKKELKALGERLNFLSAQVDEMAIDIDNLIQHKYSFNVKLVGMPEITEPSSKETAIDTTILCVRIFQAMGCNDND